VNQREEANIVLAFTPAALRAKEAGQFLSLALNQPTDENGGTVVNRAVQPPPALGQRQSCSDLTNGLQI
jgi:2,4-dienoyl-CoA reductase-like NADH-dependent reductase (Old Yellow Enzyme family)